MKSVTPEEIDAELPQTQCGLCGYGGCMPYAEALVFAQAPINLCPPGGIATLTKLGGLLGQDHSPYISEMLQKQKPTLLAVIREQECIGCTKCIQVCPVDAIIGTAKEMHAVITAECTGCELCVPACPVDCIDMIISTSDGHDKTGQFRDRFNARNKRLAREEKDKKTVKLQMAVTEKKNYISAGIARVKAKKSSGAK